MKARTFYMLQCSSSQILKCSRVFNFKFRTVYCCTLLTAMTRSQGYTTFLFSSQLSMKFQLVIESKILKNNHFPYLKHSDVVFILPINVKMPTIVGILTSMSMIISCSAELSLNEKFYNFRPGHMRVFPYSEKKPLI